MTYTEQQLAEDIAGCQAAIRSVMTPDQLSISDRSSTLDAGRLDWLRDRLRQLNEEAARRRRQRPPAVSSTPAPAAAKTGGTAKTLKSRPLLDDDLAGPPIIIKDKDGTWRTWRPGDSRIHRKSG